MSATRAPQVAHGPLHLGGDVFLGAGFDLGHFGLGLLLEVLPQLVGGLVAGSSMMRADSFLASASWRRYSSRIPLASSAGPLGLVEAVCGILSARASMPFLTAG